MAVEKDKVLAAIELRFKGKSLTKTYKESLATKWAAKIDNETDIDNYINDREEDILEAASEADRRATEAVNKAKHEAPKTTEPNPVPDDAPAWFKAYTEQQGKTIEELKGQLSGFQQQQTQKTIEQRFKADERLKGVPEFLFKGRIPKTEDELESAITELATDWQGHSKTQFGNDNPGYIPGSGKGADKVDSDIASFAKKQNESFINSKN